MVKILIGLVAGIVIAAAGFFGFQYYSQHRVIAEIETVFDQIRASGGKASHGNVSFDLGSRTLAIADVAVETAAQPPVGIKIARLTAAGVNQPDAARFSADTIEATDLELDANLAANAEQQLVYKAPLIAVKDYSGPASLSQLPASASVIDIYRLVLQQFAAVSASSVTVPSILGTIHMGTAMSAEVTYSNAVVEDIKDGKVAVMKVERVGFTITPQQAAKAAKITGEMANLVSRDFDSGATAAMLDPQKANDDHYYRMYGLTAAGPLTFKAEQGQALRIDRIRIDDVGVRPSRLQLPALFALIPPRGTVPTPAQTRDIVEKMAHVYEGIHIGNAEMSDLSVQAPQGPFKLAGLRLNIDGGKFGELAIEGLDMRSPQGPVKVGRFALRSLDLANLLRLSAQFSTPSQQSASERFVGLFRLLEGAEIEGVVAPYKNTSALLNVDTVKLDWGQFVGPIPSKAHLIAKMSIPIDPSESAFSKTLVTAGINAAAVNIDLGAAWTEASRAFEFAPVTVEIGNILSASAHVSLANVPREAFSGNPQQIAVMAAQIEAGTVDIVLRDSGGVDLAVAQYARSHNIAADAARSALIDDIKNNLATMAATNPDATALSDALARFVTTAKGTLTVKLTPVGKVPVTQLVQKLKADPQAALTQFRIEASTTP